MKFCTVIWSLRSKSKYVRGKKFDDLFLSFDPIFAPVMRFKWEGLCTTLKKCGLITHSLTAAHNWLWVVAPYTLTGRQQEPMRRQQ